MTTRRVLVLPGDGIGQEVIPAAVTVLQALLPQVELLWGEAGFAAFEKHGSALPAAVLRQAREVDGILFGATSSPSRRVEGYHSPILTLRRELGLCANLRPARSWLVPAARPGVDLVIVRENCEGLYVREERMADPDTALAVRRITRRATQQAAQVALAVALQRARKRTPPQARITVVHKANVLSRTDGLFRQAALDLLHAARKAHPDVTLDIDEVLVDTAALRLVQRPEAFDVLLTPNLYGDILSDLAAGLVGGLGLAPSLSVGQGPPLAEPVHGSAPDIAGKGIANPLAAILAVGLLLAHWGMAQAAARLEAAVEHVLGSGVRTPDLGGSATTEEVTRAILTALSASRAG